MTWSKPLKKTIYTLNIDNYAPEICSLTYPLIKGYADKIGAAFKVISERKFPEWPVTYEKLQIFELGQQDENDWNIYIDADAIVNPDFFDITDHMNKDVVCHNGMDMAGIRWKYDQYFRRDGRHIGSGNWFAAASDWCLDLWHPLELSLDEALVNIVVANHEREFNSSHLIDDYTLSRNIAKYGLKFTTVADICGAVGFKGSDGHNMSPFLTHLYNISEEEKLSRLLSILTAPVGSVVKDPREPQIALGFGLGLMEKEMADTLRSKWGLNS